MGRKLFLEPNCMERNGIPTQSKRRHGRSCCPSGKKRGTRRSARWLTARAKPFTLNSVNRGCPGSGNVLRFVFVVPFLKSRWEVVQLAGLQILNLTILVRVQASQPKFFPL